MSDPNKDILLRMHGVAAQMGDWKSRYDPSNPNKIAANDVTRENELVAVLNGKDAELSKLKSQRDQLMEVVRPFAEHAQYCCDMPDDESVWWEAIETSENEITVGDLRKARDIRNEILNQGDKDAPVRRD